MTQALDFTRLDRVRQTPVEALPPAQMMWLSDPDTRRAYLRAVRKAHGPVAAENAKWLAEFFRYAGGEYSDFLAHQYVASVIGTKADPWGRLPLYHGMAQLEGSLDFNIGIAWAGAQDEAQLERRWSEGVMVGQGYTHGEQMLRDTDDLEPGSLRYARTHIPMSVSQAGAGIGFAFYCTHALTARFMYGLEGSYSARSLGREAPAEEWWTKAAARGFAKEKRLYGREAPNGVEGETLSADDVLTSNFVALLMQPAGSPAARRGVPVGCWMKPAFAQTAAATYAPSVRKTEPYYTAEEMFDRGEKSWRPEMGKPRANLISAGVEAGIYDRTGLPVYCASRDSAVRVDLLARVWHGPSPLLTVLIMEMLAQASPTRAVDYATRPDVAYSIRRHPKLLALVQKLRQRAGLAGMPGLSGLSAYEVEEIAAAAAAAGPMDEPKGANPFHLPPMGAAARATLTKYEGL